MFLFTRFGIRVAKVSTRTFNLKDSRILCQRQGEVVSYIIYSAWNVRHCGTIVMGISQIVATMHQTLIECEKWAVILTTCTAKCLFYQASLGTRHRWVTVFIAAAFLGSACVKASLWRWGLLFHLSLPIWESRTVGRRNKNLYVRACVRAHDDGQITSSFSSLYCFDHENFRPHSCTHSTSTSHPRPDTNQVHKEPCPPPDWVLWGTSLWNLSLVLFGHEGLRWV